MFLLWSECPYTRACAPANSAKQSNHDNWWVSTKYSLWKGGNQQKKAAWVGTWLEGDGGKELKQQTIPQKLRDKLFSAYHHICRRKKKEYFEHWVD